MNESFFTRVFEESVQCKTDFIAGHAPQLAQVAGVITGQLRKGNKILLFGNGGSAADAQHLAAEFVNRLILKRTAIPALSLVTDTSVITSIANDDAFDRIFSRQIQALGVPGDIAWGFSTSGNSRNVIDGFEAARAGGLICVASLGATGGRIKAVTDYFFCVPSSSPQRIQEVHITIGHAVCEWVERSLFSEKRDKI